VKSSFHPPEGGDPRDYRSKYPARRVWLVGRADEFRELVARQIYGDFLLVEFLSDYLSIEA